MTLTGACLCGGVAYEAEGPASPIVHCHCETCRRAHGAAFASVVSVPRAGFRWARGEGLLKAFDSSPGKVRRFCGRCGSHILAERKGADAVMLRLGCLDGDPGTRPMAHIWRSDAAPWYDPKTELPELPEGLPKRG